MEKNDRNVFEKEPAGMDAVYTISYFFSKQSAVHICIPEAE